jgi:hypothetical protein
MFDSKLMFRRSVTELILDTATGDVSSNAATADMTHALYTSGWLRQLNGNTRGPFPGYDIGILFAGKDASNRFTSTGAAGTSSLIWKVQYSTDGTNALADVDLDTLPMVATYASSVSSAVVVNGVSYTLPRGFRIHVPTNQFPYVRILGTTTLGTITGCNYGPVHAGILLPAANTAGLVELN